MDLRRNIAAQVRAHPALWNLLQPPYRRVREAANFLRLWRHHRYEMRFEPEAGNLLVRELLLRGQPALIGKVGSLEAEALHCFLAGRDYPPILAEQLLINVGIHPNTRTSLAAFCAALLAASDQLDLAVAWGNPGETQILNHAGRSRPLIRLRALESWRHDRPWSEALAGKRVLVVHPFAASIERQYAKRRQLWPDPRILPDFALRTVKMPLSPGLVPPEQPDWQSRLAALITQIDQAPYDVMLVGAGGLSLLLAAHAKQSGAIGIHLGGHTQILFGITGKRWAPDQFLARIAGAAWVRPSLEETPDGAGKVEQGAYW